MEKDELELFYLLDNHDYLVKQSASLKKLLKMLDGKFSEKDVQNFIDKLISWYQVKFSDYFLESLFNNGKKTDTTILEIMNFDKLQKSYGVFEDKLFDNSVSNNSKIIFQKQLVIMAGWGLIYYRKSNPNFGYYRACQLLNDFNSFYSWNLTPIVYNSVLNRDYSLDNDENKKMLEKKRNKHIHEKNKKIKKRRFLFHR